MVHNYINLLFRQPLFYSAFRFCVINMYVFLEKKLYTVKYNVYVLLSTTIISKNIIVCVVYPCMYITNQTNANSLQRMFLYLSSRLTLYFARRWLFIPCIIGEACQHSVPLKSVSVITVERHNGTDSGRVSQIYVTVWRFRGFTTIYDIKTLKPVRALFTVCEKHIVSSLTYLKT